MNDAGSEFNVKLFSDENLVEDDVLIYVIDPADVTIEQTVTSTTVKEIISFVEIGWVYMTIKAAGYTADA